MATVRMNEKFIDAYRRFESALRKIEQTVKQYEDSLTSDLEKQGKIRMCRLIRNYIEHENSAFVEASENMIDFLIDEATKFDESETPVKKNMIAVRYGVKETDLVVVAADFMTKRNVDLIPVFDDKEYATGVISRSDIVSYVAAGQYSKVKKVSAINRPHKFGFLNENAPMRQVRPLLEKHDKVYLVLNDSKRVIGWVV